APFTMWLLKQLPRPDLSDPNVLLLRPPTGFGDHLMLSAVIEGLKAERPEYRVYVAAGHPELFRNNPHVEEAVLFRALRKRDPELADRYRLIRHRPPEERYLQVTGHL